MARRRRIATAVGTMTLIPIAPRHLGRSSARQRRANPAPAWSRPRPHAHRSRNAGTTCSSTPAQRPAHRPGTAGPPSRSRAGGCGAACPRWCSTATRVPGATCARPAHSRAADVRRRRRRHRGADPADRAASRPPARRCPPARVPPLGLAGRIRRPATRSSQVRFLSAADRTLGAWRTPSLRKAGHEAPPGLHRADGQRSDSRRRLSTAVVAIRLDTSLTNDDGSTHRSSATTMRSPTTSGSRIDAKVRRARRRSTPPVAHVPRFDHVFVYYFENQDYRAIIGNTKQAPYFNSLIPKAACSPTPSPRSTRATATTSRSPAEARSGSRSPIRSRRTRATRSTRATSAT